ncbi:unnamed protein product [Vitrella brassicaformis CCMP3155]|uniref:Uncharacterized protein n=2 Tax=Vitrella brassicaformis TaxID=1169539 RepID=A0A0G4G191_VITBC|nr:unnamed protein product [Vitrella brassicaformis CCMP3155]|eukprot:CEM21758.1 unnamed protein product [Vitrella brassicaformis CCMP3155]
MNVLCLLYAWFVPQFPSGINSRTGGRTLRGQNSVIVPRPNFPADSSTSGYLVARVSIAQGPVSSFVSLFAAAGDDEGDVTKSEQDTSKKLLTPQQQQQPKQHQEAKKGKQAGAEEDLEYDDEFYFDDEDEDDEEDDDEVTELTREDVIPLILENQVYLQPKAAEGENATEVGESAVQYTKEQLENMDDDELEDVLNNVINAMEDMDIMDTLTRDDMVNELLEDPSILPPEYNNTQKLEWLKNEATDEEVYKVFREAMQNLDEEDESPSRRFVDLGDMFDDEDEDDEEDDEDFDEDEDDLDIDEELDDNSPLARYCLSRNEAIKFVDEGRDLLSSPVPTPTLRRMPDDRLADMVGEILDKAATKDESGAAPNAERFKDSPSSGKKRWSPDKKKTA